MELNLSVLTLSGRVLKLEKNEELRDKLTLLPFKDEKNFVPQLQTIVNDEILDSLESVDELPKHLFMQGVQKHYSAVARYVLKQMLGGEFSQLLKELNFLNHDEVSKRVSAVLNHLIFLNGHSSPKSLLLFPPTEKKFCLRALLEVY